MTRPQPCGTPAAYQRHIRRGEKPCEPCREAWRAYIASQRSGNEHMRAEGRKNTRAHHRAKQRLADAHRAEYEALLLEEKLREWAI